MHQSNLGICQKVDTIIVSNEFVSKGIGEYCFHRIGSTFMEYGKNTGFWTAIDKPNYKLNFDSTHWLFAVIKNTSNNDKTLILYLNNVQAGFVKLYVKQGGITDSSLITGSLIPVSERATRERVLSFPILLPQGQTTEIYLKTWRSHVSITLTPVLEDASISNYASVGDNFIIISVALLFLILVVSILLCAYFPAEESIWLLFYMAPSFLYVLTASGMGSLYFWSSHPIFEANAAIFFGNISGAGFLEFSRRTLKLSEGYPVLNKIVIAFSITHSLLGVLGFNLFFNMFSSIGYGLGLMFSYLIMMVLLIFIFFVCINKSIVKKQKQYYWFVIIFVFYIFYFYIAVFIEAGIITYNYNMQTFLLPFGVLPQMTLILIYLIHKAIKIIKEREFVIANTVSKGQQDVLKERIRISQDLHDEIGATLSGISMYSHLTKEQFKNAQTDDAEKSLNIIQQSAGSMVNKLSDMVWLTNPGQDNVQQLLQRLEEYLTEIGAAKKIQVQTKFWEQIADINISAESRRNIYLIFKEAINNAVKYSNAELIQLDAIQDDGYIKISLTDNGVGFDMDEIKRGNGLNNMQKRAKDSDNQLNITSKKESGTNISVSIKITQ